MDVMGWPWHLGGIAFDLGGGTIVTLCLGCALISYFTNTTLVLTFILSYPVPFDQVGDAYRHAHVLGVHIFPP